MKYRDFSILVGRIDRNWIQKSLDLQNQLLAANSTEERKEIIKKNSSHWSELKQHFANFSKDKCWYSERKLTETEMEIDHFRPKGSVEGIEHPGYWWLAFEFRNFRLSSATVNKKRKNTFNSKEDDVFGKGTLFPLADENNRVSDPGIGINSFTFQLGNETPILLDPLLENDPTFLDFNFQEGKVIEALDLQDGQIEKNRAQASIDIYNLNSAILLPMRIKIARDLNNLLTDAKILVEKINSNTSNASPTEIRDKFKIIVGFICDEAEFCTFSRSYLMSRRHEFPELIDKIMART